MRTQDKERIMNHVRQEEEKKKRFSTIQIIRAIIQAAAFLLVPGLFITMFSGIGSVYTSLIGGTFDFFEQAGNIVLIAAALILTALWGRFFCGFICSFGAMQDLLWLLGKHIVKKPLIREKADRVLKYLKYAVLIFIVIGVWTFSVGEDTVWSPWTVFGMYASPLKGFPSQAMFLSLGGVLLLAVVICSLFIERFFCKYVCPLGAVFSIVSKLRVFRIKKPSALCGSCKGCTKSCSMAIPMYKYDEIRSGECINCMKCTAACHRTNVKVSPVPAVSGTLAAAAIAGITFAGTLPKAETPIAVMTENTQSPTAAVSTEAVGKFRDGAYSGTGMGYRGETSVTVKVSSGNITEITVDSSRDDNEFLSKAQSQVIPDILEAQDTDVETVSGATYSSQGIIEAVEDALSDQLLIGSIKAATEALTEAPAIAPTEEDVFENETDNSVSGNFSDGVYYGSGSGYRGTTEVAVTVENGMITDITVTSYQDDYQFFSRAQSGVIDAILSQQSVDVSSVSGATFSSNSIKEAVANALNMSFTNPNSSMGGKKHGKH